MNIKEINKQVYYSTDTIVKINRENIAQIKKKMEENAVERIRICAHKNLDDKVHEMFIILRGGHYIRPHRHLTKTESFYLVEGKADIIIFKEDGQVTERFKLGEFNKENHFFCRFCPSLYHTVMPISDYLVLLETTSGPLEELETEYAPWAPAENTDEGKKYIKKFFELQI